MVGKNTQNDMITHAIKYHTAAFTIPVFDLKVTFLCKKKLMTYAANNVISTARKYAIPPPPPCEILPAA